LDEQTRDASLIGLRGNAASAAAAAAGTGREEGRAQIGGQYLWRDMVPPASARRAAAGPVRPRGPGPIRLRAPRCCPPEGSRSGLGHGCPRGPLPAHAAGPGPAGRGVFAAAPAVGCCCSCRVRAHLSGSGCWCPGCCGGACALKSAARCVSSRMFGQKFVQNTTMLWGDDKKKVKKPSAWVSAWLSVGWGH